MKVRDDESHALYGELSFYLPFCLHQSLIHPPPPTTSALPSCTSISLSPVIFLNNTILVLKDLNHFSYVPTVSQSGTGAVLSRTRRHWRRSITSLEHLILSPGELCRPCCPSEELCPLLKALTIMLTVCLPSCPQEGTTRASALSLLNSALQHPTPHYTFIYAHWVSNPYPPSLHTHTFTNAPPGLVCFNPFDAPSVISALKHIWYLFLLHHYLYFTYNMLSMLPELVWLYSNCIALPVLVCGMTINMNQPIIHSSIVHRSAETPDTSCVLLLLSHFFLLVCWLYDFNGGAISLSLCNETVIFHFTSVVLMLWLISVEDEIIFHMTWVD